MTECKRVFLDTAPIVYFLDNNEKYGKKVQRILENLLEDEKELVSSVITCEEYLVFAYRNNNQEKVDAFFDFMEGCFIPLYDITVQTARKASQIRAAYKSFKAMDALQLAVACQMGCDLFLTNDKQLKQFKEIPCITIDELE